MRTSINKKSDFDFIVLDNEGNAVDMPSNDFTIDLWTWGSKCRFRASSIGGVLKGCKSDNGKLRVYVDNPGFVPGKLVGEWVSYVSSEEYPDGTQRTCRYISDFGIDMVDGDSTTNEQQVLAMMQYIQGASAYEIACENGFDGTEQEWLDSLALPANEAAAECTALITELSNAEAERVANEDVRTANEETRVQQESTRVTAEQQRVQADGDRALAETNRGLNEQFRGTNEQQRIDNEAARVAAEKNRVANEKSRVSDEALRVQAETERVEAESSRAAAESSRVTAEATRAEAEEQRKTTAKEYAAKESDRRQAERDRQDAEDYRSGWEIIRQDQEQDRMNAESARKTAEYSRETAEDARIANEATRQTNEQARVAAETNRDSAETERAAAEAARVEAEQARAEEFAGFAATLAAKENVANKVTSINADADDVHYPSAKAVKDSLAKVKNIEVTPDMLSESTKQFINASGGGTITNFADDEDLTSVDNALKLADKTYDPITYSGMGRKYLRKNLVDGKNILTQEMLPSANTIYIIQYDYDLNGATITIPENCTLDFQGGSLANGKIVLSKYVNIESSIKEIFKDISITVNNAVCIDKIHPDWFNGTDQEKIQTCINIVRINGNMWAPTIFLSREYSVTDEFDCTYLFDTAGPHPRVSLHIEGINPNRSKIHIKAGGNINNKPLFNCTGLNYGTFKNFSVSCESGLSPYCAFLLLRNSTNTNAGSNKFENITCLPYYFQYHYLIIGSESNSFINCGGATVYLDSYVPNNDIISDYYIRYDESYGGCTRNLFYRCDFKSIYLGSSVTNTTFVGCYTNGGIRCVKSNSMVTFIDHRDETHANVVPSFIVEENVTISNYYFDGKLNGVLGKDGSILKNCVISESSNLKSGVSTEISGEIPSLCSFYLYDSYSSKYGAVGGSVIIRNKSLANESTNLITSTAVFENDDSDIKHLYLNNNNAVRHINYPQKAELYDFNHLLKCGALSYDFESINITQDGKISLNPLSPSVKVITLSANVTGLILSNSRYNKGAYYQLIFVQDSVGNHMANLNVAYIRGFTPHVNMEANSVTIVEIMELNGSFYYTHSGDTIKGSSAARPANIAVGFQYFDTTLNKPIWWNGSAWVDATGATV